MIEHHLVYQLFNSLNNVTSKPFNKLLTDLDLSANELDKLIATLNSLVPGLLHSNSGIISISHKCVLLDKELILNELSENWFVDPSHIEILTSIESSNDYLRKKEFSSNVVRACLAEHQSQGRGRRGKSWVSPFAQNIYLSVAKRCFMPIEQLGLVSLLVGITIAEVVSDQDINDVQVKWPNDVYCNGLKLAGVLIETNEVNKDYADLIIGIGVNCSMQDASGIDQPWTSLQKLMEKEPDRNLIAADLINQLLISLSLFEQNGFSEFEEMWQKYDYLYGKPVQALGHADINGFARGINEIGELIIETNTGQQAVRSGEVSVRLENSKSELQ